ncbi:MAG: undecaprenyl-diphosphate phosphatase [Candidatus Bathyarchaeia archaeon]
METNVKIILLGIIQGLTEWLPVSSTGHLKIIEVFLGLSPPVLFDIALHLGTLIVTIFYFRYETWKIFVTFVKLDFKSKEGYLALRIIAGLIPTAIIGLFILKFLENVFQESILLAIAFVSSGLVIYFSKIGKHTKNYVDFKSAIIIGVAQGLSIIPGLSRSGLTISVALILGINYEEAFKFSFLLSIPAILGALIVTMYYQTNALLTAGIDPLSLLIGSFVAMLLGYFSLKILHKFLYKFHLFAFYSLFLGLFIMCLHFI